MAPKNQGISGLNIGDTDTLLKALGRPKTFNEIAEQYALGLEGKGALKDKFMPKPGQIQSEIGDTKFISGLKGLGNLGIDGFNAIRGGAGIISAFTNPSGNIISDYAGQESDDSFQKRINQKVRRGEIGLGSEMFLPNENSPFRVGNNVTGAQTMSDVAGMDIFTEAGQQALTDQINSATLGENVPDPRAFNAGDSANADTVNKIKEQIEKENIDTSDPDSDIDYTDSYTDAELTEAESANEIEGADTNAKKATVGALNDFLNQVRDGKKSKPKNYDEYIKEFGDATGLDISGDPDNKQALMSFGLALMQNRAGKGFDISKMLTSVGEAGEAAMPDFRKAVAESKAIRAKAGSYALSNAKADKAKAMNRKGYFIIPKGDGSASSLSNMIAGGKGTLKRLNSYELNNLDLNSKFNEQFEIVDADYYKDYAKAALTASGKNKFYQTGGTDIPLFAGAPKGLSFKAQLPDGNFAPAGTSPLFIDSNKRVIGMIQNMERKVENNAGEFKKLAGLLNETNVDIIDQSRSIIKQTLRNFGLDIGDTDPVKQIKTILTRIQATNAADILQESGKTLSDTDRKLVKDIVGDVNFLEGDEAVLRSKLSNLFKLIVTKGRANIKDSYDNLGAHGISIDRTNITAKGSTMVKGEDNVFRFNVQGNT